MSIDNVTNSYLVIALNTKQTSRVLHTVNQISGPELLTVVIYVFTKYYVMTFLCVYFLLFLPDYIG